MKVKVAVTIADERGEVVFPIRKFPGGFDMEAETGASCKIRLRNRTVAGSTMWEEAALNIRSGAL